MARGSISDLGIAIRNREICNFERRNVTKQMWTIAKKVEVTAQGDEEEIIQRIEGMKNRDTNARKEAMEKENGGRKRSCGFK
ncbi:hypothetical protein SLA2020_192720 [Shorea laevis]